MKKFLKKISLYFVLIITFPIGMIHGVSQSIIRWFCNLDFSEVHTKWILYKELIKQIKEETK